MKIFVSSVRRGLEEERDALPGLITAVGHTPVRFEDFSAQPLPSREACLLGMGDADAYLLILGPNYGHRFDDTGQSPTHDEWVAASAAGMPRLVYRKIGVSFEAEQEEFAHSIGDYTSGVFYDSFSTTAELLTKVAAKLRELEQAGGTLTYSPIIEPVTVTWRSDFGDRLHSGHSSSTSILEVHVVPIGTAIRSARTMSDLAAALPMRMRDSRLVDAGQALTTGRPGGGVEVSLTSPQTQWDLPRESRLLGVRVGVDGQASAWATLPGDTMGSILDATDLSEQIAGMLRLIGSLRIVESSQVALGVGVDPTMMLSTGRVAQLPRQSATMLSMSECPIRVPPDELVTIAALDVGATEVARALSRSLLEAIAARP